MELITVIAILLTGYRDARRWEEREAHAGQSELKRYAKYDPPDDDDLWTTYIDGLLNVLKRAGRIVSSQIMNESLAASAPKTRPIPAILVGGLIVGVLDLAYAIFVYSPRRPILIPQTIASGILGPRSYDGGYATAALGVVLHFFIALSAAAVYYLASRRLKFLVRHAVASGLIYGGWVYLFMHIVVLPLSAKPAREMPFVYQATEFVEHWFFVGLPIALSVHHYRVSNGHTHAA